MLLHYVYYVHVTHASVSVEYVGISGSRGDLRVKRRAAGSGSAQSTVTDLAFLSARCHNSTSSGVL